MKHKNIAFILSLILILIGTSSCSQTDLFRDVHIEVIASPKVMGITVGIIADEESMTYQLEDGTQNWHHTLQKVQFLSIKATGYTFDGNTGSITIRITEEGKEPRQFTSSGNNITTLATYP